MGKFLVHAALATTCLSTPAMATVYNFHLYDLSAEIASGQIFCSPNLDGSCTGYDITGFSNDPSIDGVTHQILGISNFGTPDWLILPNLRTTFNGFSFVVYDGGWGINYRIQYILDVNPLFPGSFSLQDDTHNPAGSGNGRTALLTLSQAAVTEPTSWAMMIVGFGAIGLAVRKKRTMVRFN